MGGAHKAGETSTFRVTLTYATSTVAMGSTGAVRGLKKVDGRAPSWVRQQPADTR